MQSQISLFWFFFPKSSENDFIIPLVGSDLLPAGAYSTRIFVVKYLVGYGGTRVSVHTVYLLHSEALFTEEMALLSAQFNY